jgi:glutamyl-tRNA synthetase
VTKQTVPTGRLAPSPTGLLHLGHARTFLLGWWHVRSRGGALHLRIDDLDAGRSEQRFVDAALLDLEWLGLDWDGPVVTQSARVERYRHWLGVLIERGLAYPCVCSRGDVQLALGAPHATDGEVVYPGTCRGRFASIAAAEGTGKAVGLRLDVSSMQGRELCFQDGISGEYRQDVAAVVGDFLIGRRDGTPSYQLAVVVDDAEQNVTEVFRGDDLLASTPRQLLLQEWLGFPHPDWYHVPLVVTDSGRRLAKRHDDLSIAELRRRNVDPRAIVRWVAQSAGMTAPELVRAAELLHTFSLDRIPGTTARAPSFGAS